MIPVFANWVFLPTRPAVNFLHPSTAAQENAAAFYSDHYISQPCWEPVKPSKPGEDASSAISAGAPWVLLLALTVGRDILCCEGSGLYRDGSCNHHADAAKSLPSSEADGLSIICWNTSFRTITPVNWRRPNCRGRDAASLACVVVSLRKVAGSPKFSQAPSRIK